MSQPETLRFTLETDGRRQTLEARHRTTGELDVSIAVGGACSRQEAGVAKPDSRAGDAEVEVDLQGEGHATHTYSLVLRDECTVSIRIASPDRSHAWLREADCKTRCALSADPMPRR